MRPELGAEVCSSTGIEELCVLLRSRDTLCRRRDGLDESDWAKVLVSSSIPDAMLPSGDMLISGSFLSFRDRFADVDATDFGFALVRRGPFRDRFVTLFAAAGRSRIVLVLIYKMILLNESYGMLKLDIFCFQNVVFLRCAKEPLVGDV